MSFSKSLSSRFSINVLALFLISLSMLSLDAYGYGVGLSSYPLPAKSGAFSTEVTNNFSGGSGLGLQARYTHKISQIFALDGNIAASDSRRSRRFGLAGDIELFSDLNKMPRIGVRPFYERSTESNRGYNLVGVVPVFSKGYIFKEKIGYPFVALPVTLAFTSEDNTYETRVALAVGMTGKLPISGYDNLLYNLEGNINLYHNFTSLLFGLSYPL